MGRLGLSNGCEIRPKAVKFYYVSLTQTCCHQAFRRRLRVEDAEEEGCTSRTSNTPNFALQAWNIPFGRIL